MSSSGHRSVNLDLLYFTPHVTQHLTNHMHTPCFVAAAHPVPVTHPRLGIALRSVVESSMQRHMPLSSEFCQMPARVHTLPKVSSHRCRQAKRDTPHLPTCLHTLCMVYAAIHDITPKRWNISGRAEGDPMHASSAPCAQNWPARVWRSPGMGGSGGTSNGVALVLLVLCRLLAVARVCCPTVHAHVLQAVPCGASCFLVCTFVTQPVLSRLHLHAPPCGGLV